MSRSPTSSPLKGSPSGPLPPQPQPLGLASSFGFGDRLGLATPGHISAARRFSFAPVFAQISPRDLDRAGQRPDGLVQRIRSAAHSAGYSRSWGADADGVKTEADIERMSSGGFTGFTLDPAAFVENRADRLSPEDLAEEVAILSKEGVLPANWIALYANRRIEFDGDVSIAPDLDSLCRAAVKFGRALVHAQRLARHVSRHAPVAPADMELAFVESATPATPIEHLFIGLEARRRNLPLTALALRWDAGFEAVAEFRGDPLAFEEKLRLHAAIARHCGPYKLSFHHGCDKISVLGAITRACGGLVHIKTAGASYLEALRLVARTAPDLFREIAGFARVRFETDRLPHVVSTTPEDVERLFRLPRHHPAEVIFLDDPVGRQFLDATWGSVLGSGITTRGRPFRDAIQEILLLQRDDYAALLDVVFTRHLEALNRG